MYTQERSRKQWVAIGNSEEVSAPGPDGCTRAPDLGLAGRVTVVHVEG